MYYPFLLRDPWLQVHDFSMTSCAVGIVWNLDGKGNERCLDDVLSFITKLFGET